MKMYLVVTALALLSSPNVIAAELASQRAAVLSQSDVWSRPAWMSEDLSIASNFDIKAAPQVKETQGLLEKGEVHCLMTEKHATSDRGTGKTPKFDCDLMKVNEQTGKLEVVMGKKDKPVKLKVKYSTQTVGMPGVMIDNNPEIQAEVVATRLMSALGFTADRMFLVKKLNCYGCSTDPWNIRTVDQSSLETPRVFTRSSIEFKFDADEILNNEARGWSYIEVLNPNSFSSDRAEARQQLLERQALFIIAGMLQHSDNKADNHRLICDGKLDDQGICSGKVKLMIQDLGFTFGGGTMLMQIPSCLPHCSSKAELKQWSKVPLWLSEDNGRSCAVNMGFSFEMKHPTVTNEARKFTAQLLRKFVEGKAGQQRLLDLFKSGDLEASGRGSAAAWAKVFIEKIEEIENPAVSDNNKVQGDRYAMYDRETRADRMKEPELHCNARIDSVVEKILQKQTAR